MLEVTLVWILVRILVLSFSQLINLQVGAKMNVGMCVYID